MKHNQFETSGVEALRRRDLIETFVTSPFPRPIQRLLSAALTTLTGLAPTANAGRPIWKGNETRSVIYMLLFIFFGATAVCSGGVVLKMLGGLALVSGMRSFAAGTGHHLLHSKRHLPWPEAWTEAGYDVLSAFLLLPDYKSSRSRHNRHHVYVGGTDDPDEIIMTFLGVDLRGSKAVVATLLNPLFHGKFLLARINDVLGRGPVWRRLLAAMGVVAISILPLQSLAAWLGFTVVCYQAAAVASWVSLHLWGHRTNLGPVDNAIAVTYGRLLIPNDTPSGLLTLLPFALVRLLWLQADLPNHDLHHVGKGPWTEAPYVRTRLLLEGFPLRQTNGILTMIQLGFEGASSRPSAAVSKLTSEDLLGM